MSWERLGKEAAAYRTWCGASGRCSTFWLLEAGREGSVWVEVTAIPPAPVHVGQVKI